VLEHPNPARYPGQRLLVVRLNGYAHLVCCPRDLRAKSLEFFQD
jgi:hypothetical protein